MRRLSFQAAIHALPEHRSTVAAVYAVCSADLFYTRLLQHAAASGDDLAERIQLAVFDSTPNPNYDVEVIPCSTAALCLLNGCAVPCSMAAADTPTCDVELMIRVAINSVASALRAAIKGWTMSDLGEKHDSCGGHCLSATCHSHSAPQTDIVGLLKAPSQRCVG